MNTRNPAYVMGFMALLCLVFGGAISIVHYATQPVLQRNEQMLRDRVLCQAFQLEVAGTAAADYAATVARHIQVTQASATDGTTRKVYVRRDSGHEMLGFEISGMGFWDRITAILVLAPDLSRIINLQFLDQKETPGLGARIEEPWFTRQFQGKAIAWQAAPDRRFIIGSAPNPNADNRVDAITGATQTSLSLMRFLNEELDRIKQLDLTDLPSTPPPR